MYQMGWSAQHRQRTSRTGGEPGAIRQRCFLFLRKWCQWAASVSWNACRGGYWHAARRWWSVSQLSLFSWPFLQPHPQILIPESGESHLQLSPLSAISDNNSMGRSKWIDHTFSPEESYHPVSCPCLALFTKYQPWFLPFLGLAALKPSGATLLLRCWSSTHLHLLIRYTWVWYYLWDHRFFGGCKYWSAEDTACRLVNINILTWDLELFSIATPGKQKLACPRSW